MTYTIIVAAGSGSRFGADIPKQFLELCGRPVVMHTIDAFREAFPDGEIVLVLAPSMITFWHELCTRHGFESPRIAEGGATRWESVRNAIQSLKDAPAGTTVMVHDGARPLTEPALIRRVASYALNTDGALPAISVSDSLRRLDDNEVTSEAVDRTLFRAVQTPQAFALWRIREAYALPYEETFTDDASVMAAAGFHNLVLVPGSPTNIKITNPLDLAIAEAIMKHNRSTDR